jgi:hypothetical protein
MFVKKLLPVILCVTAFHAYSDEILPIRPLMSFGQNILPKDKMQLAVFVDYFQGSKQHFSDVTPSVLYGISDDFSLMLSAPIAVSYQQGDHHANGLEDASLQGEYAFYSKKTAEYSDQATVVAGLAVPSGSVNKKPPTGFGAMSYFLGLTVNRSYSDWFAFLSPGATLTTTHDRTRYGNEYLYQLGIGHNIANIKSEFLLAGLLEFNGKFSVKNSIQGVKNQNSGGNVVFATPSLWLSSKQFIAQLGVGVPLSQHLFGDQIKTRCLLAANFSWTF